MRKRDREKERAKGTHKRLSSAFRQPIDLFTTLGLATAQAFHTTDRVEELPSQQVTG